MSGLTQLPRPELARKSTGIIAGGRAKSPAKLRVRDGLLLRAVRTVGAGKQHDEQRAR